MNSQENLKRSNQIELSSGLIDETIKLMNYASKYALFLFESQNGADIVGCSEEDVKKTT